MEQDETQWGGIMSGLSRKTTPCLHLCCHRFGTIRILSNWTPTSRASSDLWPLELAPLTCACDGPLCPCLPVEGVNLRGQGQGISANVKSKTNYLTGSIARFRLGRFDRISPVVLDGSFRSLVAVVTVR